MLGAQYHDEQTVIDSAKSLSKISLTKQCAFRNAKSFHNNYRETLVTNFVQR